MRCELFFQRWNYVILLEKQHVTSPPKRRVIITKADVERGGFLASISPRIFNKKKKKKKKKGEKKKKKKLTTVKITNLIKKGVYGTISFDGKTLIKEYG